MNDININNRGNLSIEGDVVSGDKITGEVVNIHTTVQQIHTKEKLVPRMSPPMPRVFTGRDDLVMDLLAALGLDRDDSRFDRPISLILKGMGGVGKTAFGDRLGA